MERPTPSTGEYLGGAPLAEIVPLRIAESVVLLRTSAFTQAVEYLLTLNARPESRIDVLSMSMGGLASEAWVQAVNAAYDAGIFLVTAAGNNYGFPKSIVYPARFRRVLAACGVMADFSPYADLMPWQMSGSYGPDSKMATALAAFTPNIPWAEIGSPDIIDWDGQGTSSATPQIAAAAALWLQKHKGALTGWQPWQVIEMIRYALSAPLIKRSRILREIENISARASCGLTRPCRWHLRKVSRLSYGSRISIPPPWLSGGCCWGGASRRRTRH